MATPDVEKEFQDVLRAFKKQANLTSEEEDEFRFTTIQDLQSAILRIRGEQWTDRRLRALNRLDPILKTLQQYGQVVEVFVNAADMVAFIWVRCFPNRAMRHELIRPGTDEVSSRSIL